MVLISSAKTQFVFFGNPIVEAYDGEKKQNWSGAILCKSADKIIQNISDRNEFPLIEYDVPLRSKTETERCYALRWDDSVIRLYIMLGLGAYGKGLDSMNEDQISNLVRDTFNLHNKPIDNKVEQKIENTIKFVFAQNEKLRYRDQS